MPENDAAPALPEDVVVEILARVSDMVSLFRCSVACKAWRGLVADPAFLRRRVWPEGGRSSLLGFFVQRHHLSVTAQRKITKNFPTRAPAVTPAPGSELGPERRFLTYFVRNDDGLLEQAKPLAVRDGLLLVRIWPRSWDKKTILRLCVCDLLTGKRDLLTPLDMDFFDGEGVKGELARTGPVTVTRPSSSRCFSSALARPTGECTSSSSPHQQQQQQLLFIWVGLPTIALSESRYIYGGPMDAASQLLAKAPHTGSSMGVVRIVDRACTPLM